MAFFREIDSDEVESIIRESIEKVIGDEKTFHREKLKTWNESIARTCLDEFSKLKKRFKFVATCIINQRNGAGLVQHSSCFFNSETDKIVTYTWEKHPQMYCVVNVYVFSLD